jgi:hypothetical protein
MNVQKWLRDIAKHEKIVDKLSQKLPQRKEPV